jgi:hypothetical protein
MKGTDVVPEPYRFVCMACGKTARSRYGFDVTGKSTGDLGWDVSCVTHAILCAPSPKAGTLPDEPEWIRVPEDELRKIEALFSPPPPNATPANVDQRHVTSAEAWIAAHSGHLTGDERAAKVADVAAEHAAQESAEEDDEQ